MQIYSNGDHILFVNKNNGKVAILLIYVDDMIITGDDIKDIMKLKIMLTKKFELKDPEKLKHFLSIEIAR